MKYSKEAKTCEQQADLLLDRGLVANKEHPVAVLSQINYYRLSTYLYTYRDVTDTFIPGTTLEHYIWK